MTSVSNGGTTTLGLYDTQSQLKEKADITYVDNKVDPLVGGHKGFATLAQAQAAQSGLAPNTVVEVLSDTIEANNGYYLWDGTTLTKTTFSPLTQANSYTDVKVATAKAEAISTASSDATTKSNNAVIKANSYTDSRYNSLVVETEQFANQAEAAASAANIAGKVYATPSEGVAPTTGVPSGQYFNVRSSSNDNYIDEYLNNAGVAQATGKSYPSSSFVNSIAEFTALPFKSGSSYDINQRVQLANGDIVKSTVANNTTNPNVDMTGWVKVNDASQIFDESGKNQQQINIEQNFKTAETITPEMFGAKGDGITDDTTAVVNMLKACVDMPVGSGITSSQINNKLNSNSYKIIRLTRLYRTTKPIHIPPNVKIDQINPAGFFSKNGGSIGFYYDPAPVDYNTYAVATFLYKKEIDGTYTLDTDIMTLPSGSQFDSGAYIQTGQRIIIDNLSITTNQNVAVGLRAVGFAGSVANNLNIGANDGSSSRIPKVGVLTNAAWNSVFNKPTVLASVQGWVNWGSNGGMVVNYPYINMGYNSTPLADITPVFNPETHTEKGAIAITNAADAFWNQPITENWYFNYVATHHLRVLHPHIEGSSTRNVFYMIARNNNAISADIQLKPILTVDLSNTLSSIVYLKNCDIQSAIVLTGRVLGAATVVRGENSTACVTFDVSRNHYFIQAAKWGDLNLIRSINNTWAENTIYVDPVNGNDEAVGLRDLNPLKTLTNVKRLCELMNIDTVNILSNLTYAANVDLPQKITFTGQEIRGTGSALLRVSGKELNVRFNNTSLAHDSQGLLYLNTLALGKITFNCALEGTPGFIQAQNTADIDVVIKNTSMSPRSIVYGNTGYKQTIGLNIDTTATLASALVGGNATIKYCNLDSASVTYDPPSLAASGSVGDSISTTVTLQATPIGTPVSAAFSIYNVAIEIIAVVSAPNTVTVKFKNTSASAVDLASGTLTVKRI